ncbi:hypothetical protein SAMN05192561_1124 [Halopenitus malekzadehii]|uniref:Uncharacterized protein n=1 Tax=Halopenitus malekzadehii TaxID=1267564 RepID=A0A1H6JDX7_9EURY|nr:hypothetical protein [Halopenitus malekzadehii]SEH60466.1 hypothetical protein SAMN05192561_1124 [Halopenitus malekzadehii]
MAQYSKDEVTILVNGERVAQLKNFDPPEESYSRSYDETVGDDENVLLNNTDPELEGELEVSPTSPTIQSLNQLVKSGQQVPITVRFPSDDVRQNEVYTGGVFTDKSFANSFDDDPESPPNRTYTFIADDIQD